MQELWIEPIALIPRDLPRDQSDPTYFEASCRANNEYLINAQHLKPNVTYDVECEDRRNDALDSLTAEEMEQINATFQQYDINGDNGISKEEMKSLIKMRTAERKEMIEEKFRHFLASPGITEDDIQAAEFNKSRYLEQMRESQTKLIDMFEAADLDHNGVISFTEFIMAEAWWLRCTLNPEKAHLF